MNKIEELKKQIEEKELEYHTVYAQQYALKIFMNAFYGVFSNTFFRYFDIRLAAAVTCQGQVCVRGPAQLIEEKCPYVDVAYSDTDSLFIGFLSILEKRFGEYATSEQKREFIQKFFYKILDPIIKGYYETMTDSLNAYKNTFEMGFEAISDKTIFTSKKKYMMNLVHDDGYDVDLTGDTPLKTKGVEIVRTSTPRAVRDFLKEMVKIIFKTNNNDECLEFLDKFRRKFNKMEFHEIAFPRGINGLSKYGISSKGVPIHVRAAHVYNDAIKHMKLINYAPIQEGEKIKFAYIKTPNYFGHNIIACSNKMPLEILEKLEIDYELQFEKAVLSPVQLIFDVLKWETEEVASLADFF